MDTSSITASLSEFVSQVADDAVPASVREHAAWLMHDLVAVMVDGTTEDYTLYPRLLSYARASGTGGQARIFGSAHTTDLEAAALVGGVLGYAIDNEPHHTEAVLHPVAAVGPAVLCVAQQYGATGRQALTAFILGVDTAIRVATAFNGAGLYDRGFHPTPVSCGFGVAAASARLMGLDTATTQMALGIAGAQASGLLAWVDDPQEQARPLNVGLASRAGVSAALLAASGLPGYPDVFGGKYSVLRAFSDRHAPKRVLAGLGEHFTSTELAYKMHACVSFTHPALDALQDLVEGGLQASDVASVELRFAPSGYHVIDDNPLRSHCAQYLVALMLTRGVIRFADVVNDRSLDDPEVARLRKAATVVPDDELERTYPEHYRTVLTVRTQHGPDIVRDITHPVGTPENPVTPALLEKKFDRLVVPVLGARQAAELAEAARCLDSAPGLDRLLDLTVPRPE